MIKNYYPQGTYSYRISAYLYPSQASEGQIVSSAGEIESPSTLHTDIPRWQANFPVRGFQWYIGTSCPKSVFFQVAVCKILTISLVFRRFRWSASGHIITCSRRMPYALSAIIEAELYRTEPLDYKKLLTCFSNHTSTHWESVDQLLSDRKCNEVNVWLSLYELQDKAYA